MEDEDSFDLHSFIVLEILNAITQETIKQKIIFQKIAFLSLRNFKQFLELADFKRHRLGPYSESLAKTTEQLIKTGDVIINENKELEITKKGIKTLDFFHIQFKDDESRTKDEEFETVIKNIKEDFNDFTTDEMLAFIYKSFPTYIKPSIKASELDYINIFLKLYEKGKLGISKIAELLGCSYDEAYELVKENSKTILLL